MRLFCLMYVISVQISFGQINISVHDTVTNYEIDETLLGLSSFEVPVGFNEDDLYSSIPDSLKDLAIVRIDLAYSTYKSREDFDQNGLNDDRMNKLFSEWPSAQKETIDWQLYAQSSDDTKESAKELFHGFRVYYRPTPTEASVEKEIAFLDDIFEDFLKEPKTDTIVKKVGVGKTGLTPTRIEIVMDDMTPGVLHKSVTEEGGKCRAYYTKYFDKDRKARKAYVDSLKKSDEVENISTSFHGLFIREKRAVSWQVQQDSCPAPKTEIAVVAGSDLEKELRLPPWMSGGEYGVVEAVFERNPEWKNTLVVMDVTGSMSPYIAKTMAWTRETQSSELVKAFTFFNDGDRKSNKLKRTGSTGGVYMVDNSKFAEVYGQMKYTMRAGYGGDCPENNVEATIKTINKYPAFDEIVMVADNYATPRDLSITDKVRKPVHVILCGAQAGINIDYIQLAYDTGGTVHTIEDDMDMKSIKEGIKFKIGRSYFTLSRGRIVKARNG